MLGHLPGAQRTCWEAARAGHSHLTLSTHTSRLKSDQESLAFSYPHTLVPLHRKTRRYRKIAMEDKARATCTLKEHHEIFDAIKSGDAEKAAELTVKHIINAKQHMFGE